MKKVMVSLTWSEVFLVAMIGVKRQLGALKANKQDAFGFDGKNGWSIHIEGAAGEMAAAKALNRFWGGTINTYKIGGDVGGDIQVRTRSESTYDLIVREGDRNEDRFILVTGQIPLFEVVGWIKGADAKKPEFKKAYGNRLPAYFVPKDALTKFKSSGM